VAAKKKATAKPTRTGAETKSYTSASSRMQAKGKAGQRAASAAQAGKSAKAGRAAVDSTELRSIPLARAAMGSRAQYVFPDRFSQQEQLRNENKARTLGKNPEDFRGKGRWSGTDANLMYGQYGPAGTFVRGALRTAGAIPYVAMKVLGKGQPKPEPAKILGGRRGPFRDKTFDELGRYSPSSTRQTLYSEFEATGKDNRRTGGGRRGPENVPAGSGDFYGRQWSAVDSRVIPGRARGDSTQRAENQRNMAKKPVTKKAAPAAKGKKGAK